MINVSCGIYKCTALTEMLTYVIITGFADRVYDSRDSLVTSSQSLTRCLISSVMSLMLCTEYVCVVKDRLNTTIGIHTHTHKQARALTQMHTHSDIHSTHNSQTYTHVYTIINKAVTSTTVLV